MFALAEALYHFLRAAIDTQNSHFRSRLHAEKDGFCR